MDLNQGVAQVKVESGMKKSGCGGCDVVVGGKLLQTWMGGGFKSEALELGLGWCCDEACPGTPRPRSQVDKETWMAVAAAAPERAGRRR